MTARSEIHQILCDYPEHNRTDEIDHVLGLIMGVVERTRLISTEQELAELAEGSGYPK